MPQPVEVLSQTGSDASEYLDTESARSYDTLDELLSRFTLEFRPEYVVKIRNRVGPLVVGADASHWPGVSKETSGAVVVKPIDKSSWWRRLRLDSNGNLAVRSRKLHWWVLTLDLEGSVNPLQKTTAGSFRVATKWDIVRGEYRNKKAWSLGDATEGRIHWSVNYNLPEVAGSFGTGSRRTTSRDVHAEVGYAHAEVAKVELVVWPWKGIGGDVQQTNALKMNSNDSGTVLGDKKDDESADVASKLNRQSEGSSALSLLQNFIRKL